MTARDDLNLEQKNNLIKENENGLSYRQLKEKYHVSIGCVSNILKRKNEYLDDYECNRNKKLKRKMKNDISQTINENVYEWFLTQRAKRIPISGPILQQYARNIAGELGDTSGFKASNGWLDRFRSRYNIQFRVISGEAAAVDPVTIEDWSSRLPVILENYAPSDVCNCDETGLFFKLMPDRSLAIVKDHCKGGKAAKPRCFKGVDMKKLPVNWYHNRTAWMNSFIFTSWLNELDEMMQKQHRKILLFLDNAPVHPPDVKLNHISLKFFPANTTSKIQPLDQGSIRVFKANYRKPLVQHVIANANSAYSADDVNITALDAVWWIENAWKSVHETTIQNTFRKAGFTIPIPITESSSTTTFNNEDVALENTSLVELDKVLKYLTIGGNTISARDFVGVDDEAPTFNTWDDGTEKILIVDEILNEDTGPDEVLILVEPPSLSEAVQMIRRLHLLSSTQHLDLHPFVISLQSKLIDIYLDVNVSK